MPKNFVGPNTLLLTLLFFALLWKKASAPEAVQTISSREENLLLAKQFLEPTCPVWTINKPSGSTMYFNGKHTVFEPNPAFHEIFELTPEADRKRNEHIIKLRQQATAAATAIILELPQSAPYQTLVANLRNPSTAESKISTQRANEYLKFVIATHAFANTAQRAQAGNCYEFSRITLAQCHRYFFEHKLPMPKVGALHFIDAKNPAAGHVAAVFGIKPEHNNVTFHRNSLVKLLTEMNAVVADGWNKKTVVLAEDICQTDTSEIYSLDLQSEGKFAAYAKAFYNSFCDEIRYETLPPLPHFEHKINQAAFDACIQYILDVTRLDHCQADQTLQVTIAPAP